MWIKNNVDANKKNIQVVFHEIGSFMAVDKSTSKPFTFTMKALLFQKGNKKPIKIEVFF